MGDIPQFPRGSYVCWTVSMRTGPFPFFGIVDHQAGQAVYVREEVTGRTVPLNHAQLSIVPGRAAA